MLNRTIPIRSAVAAAALAAALAGPAAAQELAPHRAVYQVFTLDHGKPNGASAGTYAYELRQTCEGFVMNQRLRLELAGTQGAVVTEQQSQMTESRDSRRLQFDHRSTTNGKLSSQWKGEANLGDDGKGQARYTEPEGQTVALPSGALFPAALLRATIKKAKAGESGFDAMFYYGEKVKPPQSVNVLIGRVPKRLADLPTPDGADAATGKSQKIYFRAGFFDADDKAKGEPAFEMSSLTLDNGIELYGTHEQGESGIEYRITRLEALPKPTCN
jgi:hypothetical protein